MASRHHVDAVVRWDGDCLREMACRSVAATDQNDRVGGYEPVPQSGACAGPEVVVPTPEAKTLRWCSPSPTANFLQRSTRPPHHAAARAALRSASLCAAKRRLEQVCDWTDLRATGQT